MSGGDSKLENVLHFIKTSIFSQCQPGVMLMLMFMDSSLANVYVPSKPLSKDAFKKSFDIPP